MPSEVAEFFFSWDSPVFLSISGLKNYVKCVRLIYSGYLCAPDIWSQLIILPHIVKKKKRFGLKLRKKTLKENNPKEKYKCLAVMVIFLICGICYSHSFYSGRLEMGRKIDVDEIGIMENTVVSASDVIGKININTAEAEELMLLPSVGEGRAEDIIEYREENGDFSRIEDIMQVSGIGEKTFEEIKEQITVGE